MLVVGLTGGIGSGKSTVSDHFASLGIDIVDSDKIAREVVAPGSPILAKIEQQFGAQVILEDGQLNRTALRKIIFDAPEARRWLEALTHPPIGERTEAQLKSASSAYAIFASPLLLQSGQDRLASRICVVDVPESVQLDRAASRDHTQRDAIKKIIATQLSRQQRLARADDIIDNGGSLAHTLQQVESLHRKYLGLASTQA